MIIKVKVNQYLKGGRAVFVYAIGGTKEELAAYKIAQGENYRENEAKEPLYFSQRVCQVGAELSKTQSGKFVVLQDLEQIALNVEEAATKTIGKLTGIALYFGLTKAQLQQQMLAALAE